MSEETVYVTRSVDLPVPAREVWADIGGFQDIAEWHPAIVRSRPERAADLEYRHLTAADGAEFTEQLLDRGGHYYRYRINSSPLPVDHYESTFEVDSAGAGSRVTWSSSFTPTAPGAQEKVADIYEAGLGALRERFA